MRDAPDSDPLSVRGRLLLLESSSEPPAVDGPQRGNRGSSHGLRRPAHAHGVENLLYLREAGVREAVHGHVADVLCLVLALLVDLAEEHLPTRANERVFTPAPQHHG